MTWFVVGLAAFWSLVGIAFWYWTTPPPRGLHAKTSLGNAARLSLLVTIYVALELALGFVLLVFHTNPPPLSPERMGMVEMWKYGLFGCASFLLGMACYRNVQKLVRRLEVPR